MPEKIASAATLATLQTERLKQENCFIVHSVSQTPTTKPMKDSETTEKTPFESRLKRD